MSQTYEQDEDEFWTWWNSEDGCRLMDDSPSHSTVALAAWHEARKRDAVDLHEGAADEF